MQLFDYQITAVAAALKALLSSTAIALIELATGLGKTVIMQEVCKPFSGRILFLCHDTDILEQNMKRFAESYPDEGEVGLYHGTNKTGFNTRFVFATFQTMISAKELFGPDAFCLEIVDECHHAPAATYREVIEYFNCPKLGASATLDRLDGQKVEDIFGKPVISIGLPEAIAKGYLTPFEYRVMSDGLNQEVLKTLLAETAENRRLTVDDINKKLFIQKRDEEIVRMIKQDVGNKKTLVFCRNIDHATRISGILNYDVRDKIAAAYHSGLYPELMNERLEDFREGELQFLVVVNKANEGIDIPDVEAVVFLRSTESKIIFLQQLGRALRKLVGKERVLVLDFAGSLQRLSLVNELAWSIRDEYEKAGRTNGSHNAMTVSGDGFDFVFSAEVIEELELFERVRRTEFYQYEEAIECVRRMRIKSQAEYKIRYKENLRLPSDPPRTYSSDWVSWPWFLREQAMFYPFAEAQVRVRELGIHSFDAYRERYKEDPRLPSNPNISYKKEWSSWPAFLRDQKPFYSYTEALEIVRPLKLSGRRGYDAAQRKDDRLPPNPERTYSDQWSSWAKFLRDEEKRADFPKYQEAALIVREAGIKSGSEYRKRYKGLGLPSNPQIYYSEWQSWGVFLRDFTSFYKTYNEAKLSVHKLKIQTRDEYNRRYKEDKNLPADPSRVYRENWVDWPSFLGTK